jgi:hypothetical protein
VGIRIEMKKVNHEELNAGADKLSTKSLSLQKNHINTDMANASLKLNKFFLAMDLRDYLVTSNKWEESTPEKCGGRYMKKQLIQLLWIKRTYIQKFINTKLPCYYRKYKYYKYKPSVCSTCKLEMEAQDHILKCTQLVARKLLGEKGEGQNGSFIKINIPEKSLCVGGHVRNLVQKYCLGTNLDF